MAPARTEDLVSDLPQTISTKIKSVVSEQITPLDLAPPTLPTEKIGPMGYVRTLLHFELPDGYDGEKLAKIFKQAYTAFKERTPIAGCEIVPAPTYAEDGELQLRYYGDELEHDFAVKDLRDQEFPSYAELKSRGFPSSALKPDLVCQRGQGGEWPTAGQRLPNTLMQVNLVNGGLILNMLFFHAYIDGATIYKFTEIISEEVRRAQGLAITNPVEIPVEDRAKLVKASGGFSGAAEDHPEYLELPFTPQAPPPKLSSPIAHGHVFYFSPEKLQALKELAAPSNAKLFKGTDKVPSFISTTDALTALIWRCTMLAQHKNSESEDRPKGTSMIGLALDCRRRTNQTVHPYTIGNILGFAPAVLDIESVLQEEEVSLADIALIVRGAINKSNEGYLDSVAAMVERAENPYRFVPTFFLDMPGAHGLVSSWREFSFYDLQWGPLLGDKTQAIRFPSTGVTHCMQILLPSRPEAGPGIEAYVNTENNAMERLLNDPLWTEFAQGPESA
ncbi:trichothecene 3-o-acetyltransferase [Fusarium heterosporum]|uniref:Trichothecene 3-o-acetyltransferase n=1 Tax=Fusarium heterosporum TaxID=42747 RepID=A0A8H5TUM8_FUSHE|nr:trichothecene 3-o-acetyltransferase [Fusarium heterosporum]